MTKNSHEIGMQISYENKQITYIILNFLNWWLRVLSPGKAMLMY